MPQLTRNSAEGVLTSQRLEKSSGKRSGDLCLNLPEIQLMVSPPLSDSGNPPPRGQQTFASTYQYSAEGVLTSQRIFEKLSAKNEWEIGKRTAELVLNEVFLS